MQGSPRIFDLSNGAERVRFEHARGTKSLAWSPDGKLLAMGSRDASARIIDAEIGKEISRVVHADEVFKVSWRPDGRMLATGSFDRTIKFFDVTSQGQIASISNGEIVKALQWSPDGSKLTSGMQIVDALNWKKVTKIEKGGPYDALGWSGDGKLIAAESKIFDSEAGKLVAEFDCNGASSIAWGPNSFLAIGCGGKTVRIIESSSGKEVERIELSSPVRDIIWVPRKGNVGSAIMTGSEGGSATIWKVFPIAQDLVNVAKARAARCLTQRERAKHFLPPAPPTWCVERRLWPYHSDEWQAWLPKQKAWLASGRQGEAPALPKSAE